MPEPTPLNILVVDDAPENLRAFSAALESLGERVVCAQSAKEALRHLLYDDFALILLDVVMPEVDGFETARLIKGSPRTRDIPLIFTSASAETGAFQARGYALGAVDYLPTPFDPAFLRAKVAVFLDLARQLAGLKRQAAELALAMRYKDEFLSVVSHELKTPISVVMSYAELLDDDPIDELTPRQHKYVGEISAGADRLLALVNDLLDMGRIQAGRFSIYLEPTDLKEVARDAILQTSSLALNKHLSVHAIIAEDLPELLADASRVRQVLLNLLANAIKFTPPGGTIELHLAKVADAVRCEVTDTGPGIPSGLHARIFERFTQADSSATRASGGTGLGLSISKAIVESHGGAMGVTSESEAGSTFWFTLPLAATTEPGRKLVRR